LERVAERQPESYFSDSDDHGVSLFAWCHSIRPAGRNAGFMQE